MQNLRNSFPGRSESEITRLIDLYYAHLADLIVETIKLKTMPADQLQARFTQQNPEVLENLTAQGKNVIIMMGHSGNWEWAGAVTALRSQSLFMPIYRTLKNEAFDLYFKSLRSRFGARPVTDKEAVGKLRNTNTTYVVAMLADQTPGRKNGVWIKFLGQDTPFFRGTEVLYKRLNCEVVFAHVRKPSRGNFDIYFESYDPSKSGVTLAFANFLEREIMSQPENWLWSHKRWKHQADEHSKWL